MNTSRREELLRTLTGAILAIRTDATVRVGIDGVDGAGKTMFADELALALAPSGRPIIRASADGFHNPRTHRYRLGRHSPEGFFRDSYNYSGLKNILLDPLGPGGNGYYRRARFDVVTDLTIPVPEELAEPGSILIFDGIFLHRPELREYWDYSVWLEVPFAISVARGAQRGGGSADPEAAVNQRYVGGQRMYIELCAPTTVASVVVDNSDVEAPFVVAA